MVFEIGKTIAGYEIVEKWGIYFTQVGPIYCGRRRRQHGEKGEGVSMAEKKIEKCAHPGCNCPAAKGSKYCGTYCEGSATSGLKVRERENSAYAG
jgi:hypothetical protein